MDPFVGVKGRARVLAGALDENVAKFERDLIFDGLASVPAPAAATLVPQRAT